MAVVLQAPGMFATLTVQLPCSYAGGELLVRHGGREYVYGMKQLMDGAKTIGYVAFYADCEHEVQPVVDGHR